MGLLRAAPRPPSRPLPRPPRLVLAGAVVRWAGGRAGPGAAPSFSVGECLSSFTRPPASSPRLPTCAPQKTHTHQTTIQAIDMPLPPGLAPAGPPPPPPRGGPPNCVVTGRPARYRDPATGAPYADAAAFKVLRAQAAAGVGPSGGGEAVAAAPPPLPPAVARVPPGPPPGPPPSLPPAAVPPPPPLPHAPHQSTTGAHRGLLPGAGPLLGSPTPRGPRGGTRGGPKAAGGGAPPLPFRPGGAAGVGLSGGGLALVAAAPVAPPQPLPPPASAPPPPAPASGPPPAKKAKRGERNDNDERKRNRGGGPMFCGPSVRPRGVFILSPALLPKWRAR